MFKWSPVLHVLFQHLVASSQNYGSYSSLMETLRVDSNTRGAILGAICLQSGNTFLGLIQTLPSSVAQINLVNPVCDASALTNLINQGIQTAQELINATSHTAFCRFVFLGCFLYQRHICDGELVQTTNANAFVTFCLILFKKFQNMNYDDRNNFNLHNSWNHRGFRKVLKNLHSKRSKTRSKGRNRKTMQCHVSFLWQTKKVQNNFLNLYFRKAFWKNFVPTNSNQMQFWQILSAVFDNRKYWIHFINLVF